MENNKNNPVKPITNPDGKYPQCPVCGYYDFEVTGKKYTFCPNCGQVIDWTWLSEFKEDA